MENLNESIKKILLNIQYDNKFTLSENYSNVERINEAPRFNIGAAKEADIVKGLGKSLDELLINKNFQMNYQFYLCETMYSSLESLYQLPLVEINPLN